MKFQLKYVYFVFFYSKFWKYAKRHKKVELSNAVLKTILDD